MLLCSLSLIREQEDHVASAEVALDDWYRRLVELVRAQASTGRSTRSAGLKPTLQAHGFDERALGFPSFRAFLVAAEAAGCVKLEPAPTGPDVDVVIPGLEVASPPTVPGQRVRVRHDIWRAFVDWRSQWARVYDRELDRVGWFPSRPEPNERPEYSGLREAANSHPERFVPIEAASQPLTLQWITEFTGSLQGGEQNTLARSLTDPQPIRSFIQQSQALGLYERWTEEHSRRVRELIGTWTADHGLALDLHVERPAITSAPSRRQPARSGAPRTESLDSLRELVCRSVRQMSEAELLRLAIPLEYVLDDRTL